MKYAFYTHLSEEEQEDYDNGYSGWDDVEDEKVDD